MDRALLAVPLLAALLVPLPAQAQDPAAPLLSDTTGDPMLYIQDVPAGSASALYPGTDLVALRVGESQTDFTWAVEVADLRTGTDETGADGVRYDIEFQHNGRFFRLFAIVSLPALGSTGFAVLESKDSPDGEWSGVWSSFETQHVHADAASDTMTVVLPREALADLDGAAPFPGRVLEQVRVLARSGLSGGTVNLLTGETSMPQEVRDEMPNAGGTLGAFPVTVGVQQTGDARLSSAQPFRASNGEATTFVYRVEASNLGDANGTYELAVVGAPARVDVVLPVPLVHVPAGGVLQVPVLATIPFAHQHGGLDRWVLEMTDLDDPGSVGRLEMGIRYLDVPQPAGHHDTLWLHMPPDSGASDGAIELFSTTQGFMNTKQDDERAGTGRWHATGFSSGGRSYRSSWGFGLSPGLAMGLDVDLGRLGAAEVPVGTTLPLMGATLSGVLTVAPGDGFGFGGGRDGEAIASFQSAAVDIPAQGSHTFKVEVTPLEEGDRIDFEPGLNLWLDLELEYTLAPSPAVGLADETPYVGSGGYVRLPLLEYHDAVDDALAAVDGPALSAVGAQERLVNPGEAVVFEVEVSNPTNASIPMRLAVTGKNAAWAALPEDSFHLPADTTANVTLVVRAPAGALDGDRADLILQAYPRDDPSARGLLRLVVDVDTDADHPDDAAVADELTKKDTPAGGLALAALAVLAVAARRRRA